MASHQFAKSCRILIGYDPCNELMVITVGSDNRDELRALTEEFDATWLEEAGGRVMLSISNFPARVEEFEQRLESHGIVEIQRTGKVALTRLAD